MKTSSNEPTQDNSGNNSSSPLKQSIPFTFSKAVLHGIIAGVIMGLVGAIFLFARGFLILLFVGGIGLLTWNRLIQPLFPGNRKFVGLLAMIVSFVITIIIIFGLGFNPSSINETATKVPTFVTMPTSDNPIILPPSPSEIMVPTLTDSFISRPALAQPTVTARPYPTELVLWDFVFAEGETGEWCAGVSWFDELVVKAFKGYQLLGPVTDLYLVTESITGSPSGVIVQYDNDIKQQCISVSKYVPPGNYSVRVDVNIHIIAPPSDVVNPPMDTRYLLMSVLPPVDTSDADNLIAIAAQDLYLFDPDKMRLTNLADGSNLLRGDINLKWSPDGSRFVFSVPNQSLGFDVYLINADGSNLRKIGENYADMSWSPDSKQITYSDGWQGGIWVTNVDTLNTEQIHITGMNPQWSPSGSQIAFIENDDNYMISGGDNTWEGASIWLMDSDGSNLIELKKTGLTGFPSLALSPDGSMIAYGSLEMVLADGSNSIHLADLDTGQNFAWSPDGSQIAAYTGYGELWIIQADGSGKKEKIDFFVGWQLIPPAWSLDGKALFIKTDFDIVKYDLVSKEVTSLLSWYDFINGFALLSMP